MIHMWLKEKIVWTAASYINFWWDVLLNRWLKFSSFVKINPVRETLRNVHFWPAWLKENQRIVETTPSFIECLIEGNINETFQPKQAIPGFYHLIKLKGMALQWVNDKIIGSESFNNDRSQNI